MTKLEQKKNEFYLLLIKQIKDENERSWAESMYTNIPIWTNDDFNKFNILIWKEYVELYSRLIEKLKLEKLKNEKENKNG